MRKLIKHMAVTIVAIFGYLLGFSLSFLLITFIIERSNYSLALTQTFIYMTLFSLLFGVSLGWILYWRLLGLSARPTRVVYQFRKTGLSWAHIPMAAAVLLYLLTWAVGVPALIAQRSERARSGSISLKTVPVAVAPLTIFSYDSMYAGPLAAHGEWAVYIWTGGSFKKVYICFIYVS
jgi:hypothetical protein